MIGKSLFICIGRFQPLHRGHIDLIQQSLDISDEVLVIIGSAFQPATPRNPFAWSERKEMICQALPNELLSRVHFAPLRDFYDTRRWAEQLALTVQQFVKRSAFEIGPITLLGKFSDPEVAQHPYLSTWKQQARKRYGRMSSSALRDWLFASVQQSVAELHAEIEREFQPSDWLHPSTEVYLGDWKQLPIFGELTEEWLNLYNYKQSWQSAPYPPTMVTADSVLRCGESVLLIERGRRPGKGLLALPGGFIDPNETVFQAAMRELIEETSIGLSLQNLEKFLKGSEVMDHPERSQRGRVITHAFYFDLGDQPLPSVTAGDDASGTLWTDISKLASLEDRFHDDHFFILDRFLGILK